MCSGVGRGVARAGEGAGAAGPAADDCSCGGGACFGAASSSSCSAAALPNCAAICTAVRPVLHGVWGLACGVWRHACECSSARVWGSGSRGVLKGTWRVGGSCMDMPAVHVWRWFKSRCMDMPTVHVWRWYKRCCRTCRQCMCGGGLRGVVGHAGRRANANRLLEVGSPRCG
eukprot:356058-Chlamydomonas_euryale.AAC.8